MLFMLAAIIVREKYRRIFRSHSPSSNQKNPPKMNKLIVPTDTRYGIASYNGPHTGPLAHPGTLVYDAAEVDHEIKQLDYRARVLVEEMRRAAAEKAKASAAAAETIALWRPKFEHEEKCANIYSEKGYERDQEVDRLHHELVEARAALVAEKAKASATTEKTVRGRQKETEELKTEVKLLEIKLLQAYAMRQPPSPLLTDHRLAKLKERTTNNYENAKHILGLHTDRSDHNPYFCTQRETARVWERALQLLTEVSRYTT